MKPNNHKIIRERIKIILESLSLGLLIGFFIIVFTPVFDKDEWPIYWLLLSLILAGLFFWRLNNLLKRSLYEFILEEDGITLKPLFNKEEQFFTSDFNSFRIKTSKTYYLFIPISTETGLVIQNSGKDTLTQEITSEYIEVKGFTKKEVLELNTYLEGYSN